MNLYEVVDAFRGKKTDPMMLELLEALTKSIDRSTMLLDSLEKTMERQANEIVMLKAEIAGLKQDLKKIPAQVNAPVYKAPEAYGDYPPQAPAHTPQAPAHTPQAPAHTPQAPAHTPQAAKPAPVQRIIYAVMVDRLTLDEVSPAKRTSAPFVIVAQGEKGIVSFNPDSEAFCLSNVEGEITPYFNYTLKNNPPVAIRPENTVKATLDGDSWKMDGMINLILE